MNEHVEEFALAARMVGMGVHGRVLFVNPADHTFSRLHCIFATRDNQSFSLTLETCLWCLLRTLLSVSYTLTQSSMIITNRSPAHSIIHTGTLSRRSTSNVG